MVRHVHDTWCVRGYDAGQNFNAKAPKYRGWFEEMVLGCQGVSAVGSGSDISNWIGTKGALLRSLFDWARSIIRLRNTYSLPAW